MMQMKQKQKKHENIKFKLLLLYLMIFFKERQIFSASGKKNCFINIKTNIIS